MLLTVNGWVLVIPVLTILFCPIFFSSYLNSNNYDQNFHFIDIISRVIVFMFNLIWLNSVLYYSKNDLKTQKKTSMKNMLLSIICLMGYLLFNLMGYFMEKEGIFYQFSPVVGAPLFFIIYIYLVIKCGKEIRKIDLNLGKTPSNMFVYNLLLFLLPFGLLVLQPKINRYLDNKSIEVGTNH